MAALFKLHAHDPSPFARFALIVGMLTVGRTAIEVVNTKTETDELRRVNPLGKLPALEAPDGLLLFDSRVIAAYFNANRPSDARSLVAEGPAGWADQARLATAIGVMDAVILVVYERRYRPEELVHQPWLDLQQGKIDRAVALLEADAADRAGALCADTVSMGDVGVAAMLGYLDVRQEGHWRATNPGLVTWLEAFRVSVPAFDATTPEV